MKESDLLNLRKIDCDLEGHPTPVRILLILLAVLLSHGNQEGCKILNLFSLAFFRSCNLLMSQPVPWDRAWGLPVGWLILAKTLTNPG